MPHVPGAESESCRDDRLPQGCEVAGCDLGQVCPTPRSPPPCLCLSSSTRAGGVNNIRGELMVTCTLAPSKDVPTVPVMKEDNRHPAAEGPVKAGPGHVAAVEAEMGPPASLKH